MAATLGGTMRAPLMALVFAFELTWDTNALLPTILGCAVAYGFSVGEIPRTVPSEQIDRRGPHAYRQHSVTPHDRHFASEGLKTDTLTHHPNHTESKRQDP